MSDGILFELEKLGLRAKLIPCSCLSEIKDDVKKLCEQNKLNPFQKWITNERYVLDIPSLPFEPKSILIAAAPLTLVEVYYHYKEQQVKDLLCINEKDEIALVSDALSRQGNHFEYVHWLPQKRLAVRSGLAEYGRNNITYCGDWGSFIMLMTFFTDIPCHEYSWREAICLSTCQNCSQCLKNCPTAAILPERFLIDNQICLSLMNESEEPYPDWVPKSAYHTIRGCNRCQDVCPHNKTMLGKKKAVIHITEEETELLRKGVSKSEMPLPLLEKLNSLQINDWQLKVVPKTLNALLCSPDLG